MFVEAHKSGGTEVIEKDTNVESGNQDQRRKTRRLHPQLFVKSCTEKGFLKTGEL